MAIVLIVPISVVVLLASLAELPLRVVRAHERGVLFRLGRVVGTRDAGTTGITPVRS
jgi:regulator of protease activity HflC (stomatin/prohibitin superfamily)